MVTYKAIEAPGFCRESKENGPKCAADLHRKRYVLIPLLRASMKPRKEGLHYSDFSPRSSRSSPIVGARPLPI